VPTADTEMPKTKTGLQALGIVFALVVGGCVLWLVFIRKKEPTDQPLSVAAKYSEVIPQALPVAHPEEPKRLPRQEVKIAPSEASGVALSAENLFKKASPAVVRVELYGRDSRLAKLGSGFVVSEDGLIATNFHVIRGARSARVRFQDGASFSVEGVVGVDQEADLALLQIRGRRFPLLTLTDELPPVGRKVYAIGSPKGLTNTLSDGMVSGHRSAKGLTFIQTNAAVSPGSSGGPLLLEGGRVAGITTAILFFKEGQNLNIAVPASQLRLLMQRRSDLEPIDSFDIEVDQQLAEASFAEVEEALNDEKYEEALRLLGKIAQSERESARYWFALAYTCHCLEDLDNAIKAYKKGLEIEPGQVSARWHGNPWIGWYQLGNACRRAGRYEEAMSAFREALRRVPGDPGKNWILAEIKLIRLAKGNRRR
jgi:hypothetical protein